MRGIITQKKRPFQIGFSIGEKRKCVDKKEGSGQKAIGLFICLTGNVKDTWMQT